MIENRLGSAFAAKATRALIRVLTEPIVIAEAVRGVRETAVTASEADVIHPPVILEVATASTEAALADGVGHARQLAIASARAAFELRSADIRERLQVVGPHASAPPRVEMCWIANAIRVRYQPHRLAEVAEHPDVELIDLPRPIRREQIVSVGERILAPPFRNATGLTGNGVLVAVIDGESLRDTAFFQDRLDAKNNFSLEPWGTPDNHGTAVAAIVGASSPLIVGVAPEVMIHNYKVFPLEAITADEFDGELAIQQALEDGVQVANCSWGAGPAGDGSSREARACDRAWSLGMVVVKSAGNRGPAMDTLTTPADAFGLVVVGGTVPDGTTVGEYSSRGVTPHGIRPHLVAPGGRDQPLQGLRASGLIGPIGHGTSFAAPHVTGALALLLERTPAATPDDLRTELLSLCTQIPGTVATSQGAGLLQLR